ncbi:SubName: Full=Uncharacterized protein {ECO:0000313/EMBL:CCA72255.1} [Serendipita indica DSM 11827]|nr:SubName: Full=Uncharacterized protein {ECO:0000313/EMBL:CCA72255.1} [Serendipita indica DSM 11827]
MALTASRARPPLPASQQYEALARWVLNKRLGTLSMYTGFAVMVTTALLATVLNFDTGTITFLAIITVPSFTTLMCLSFILPLVLLRRWTLKAIPEPYPSYSALFRSLARAPSTYRNLGITCGSFASFALLNALCAALLGAHDWHLFMPTKRHAVNLNEKVVFLMLGNSLVGVVLAMKDMLQRRETVKWPTKVSLKPHTLFDHASKSFTFKGSAFFASSTVIGYSIVYALFRKSVYRTLMRLPLIGGFFNPAQYFHPNYLPSNAETASSCLDLHYALRECPSILRQPSRSRHHFAFLELAHMARKGPTERRVAVFNDPQKWNFISRTCFKTMGEDYGHLRRRGKPPPPPPAAAPPTPARSLAPVTPRKSSVIPNLNSSVYKPLPPPSPGSLFVKSLLSSTSSPSTTQGEGSAAPDGTAGSGSPSSSLRASAMPSIFVTKVAVEPSPAVDAAPVPPPAQPTPGIIQMVKKGIGFVFGQLTAHVPAVKTGDEPFFILPAFLQEWRKQVEKERIQFTVEEVLKRQSLDRYCVQILTGFTVASLTEDSYGTLQQDIPKVLEVLVSTLIALEEYTQELATSPMAMSADAWQVEVAIMEQVTPFADDIRRALGDILYTFGDRLNVFRLPPAVARRLQLMVSVM